MEYNVDNADAKITFIDVVLGFMQMKNADVYVTGSNSKMLSYNILTSSGTGVMRYGCILFPLQNSIMNIKEINVARGRIIMLMVVCRLPLHLKHMRKKVNI